MHFGSDNWAGAAPEILAALAQANDHAVPAYGDDALTQRVAARFDDLFETRCTTFFVATGGAANGLALSVLTPPYGTILCHTGSHVQTDECGGPEFFTGGAKLAGVAGAQGKIDLAELQQTVAQYPNHPPHSPPLAALSLTQGTECGTLYSVPELTALCEFAHAQGMAVHMDGARFANTVAATGLSPAALTWQAGIDVMSFGGTKNGCLGAEAVVFFNQNLVRDFEQRRKRGGHLLSKMRFIAAQFDAYLNNNLWLDLAGHANAMAQRLSAGLTAAADIELAYPTQINEVFVNMSAARAASLRAAGATFHPWMLPGDPSNGRMQRLITSFSTTSDDVDKLLTLAAR